MQSLFRMISADCGRACFFLGELGFDCAGCVALLGVSLLRTPADCGRLTVRRTFSEPAVVCSAASLDLPRRAAVLSCLLVCAAVLRRYPGSLGRCPSAEESRWSLRLNLRSISRPPPQLSRSADRTTIRSCLAIADRTRSSSSCINKGAERLCSSSNSSCQGSGSTVTIR